MFSIFFIRLVRLAPLIQRAAVAALWVHFTVPLWAAESLSLPQAQRLAAARSQQLIAQDAGAKAARDMAVAAGQLPDAVLKLGVTNLPSDGPDRFSLTRDFMTMRSVGVMQEITRADKRQARSARFERDAETAEAERSVALASLQRDTAMAWLDRYYQEQLRSLLLTQRGEAALQIEAADAAYRGGRGSQADLFAARSAAAQLDDRLALAKRQIETATTQLARWIGPEAVKPLGAPPALDAISLDFENLETQLAKQPEIDVLKRKEAAAQADVEVAQTNKKSDVSVELMYSQRGPAFSNMLSLNMSIPLQWDQKNRQNRELSARLALLEQVRAEREEGTRTYVAQALAMLQEWRSNRERLARYDASLLPLTAERTRAAIAAYRGAAGPLAAVLEARRGEVDMRMERLRLEMDTARLWAQINYLIPSTKDATFEARP